MWRNSCCLQIWFIINLQLKVNGILSLRLPDVSSVCCCRWRSRRKNPAGFLAEAVGERETSGVSAVHDSLCEQTQSSACWVSSSCGFLNPRVLLSHRTSTAPGTRGENAALWGTRRHEGSVNTATRLSDFDAITQSFFQFHVNFPLVSFSQWDLSAALSSLVLLLVSLAPVR